MAARRLYLGRAERTTKAGAVLLSANHLTFLHGLLDRPNGLARSYRDLLTASMPYALALGYRPRYIAYSLQTINFRLIDRRSVGNRVECQLTDRGRAILNGSVLAHVIGLGEYKGFRALRAKAKR